jgi:putative addiction module killer protein
MTTIYTTEVFDAWFESLKDRQTARRIQARIDRAEEGNFGDHKTVVKVCQKCGFTLALAFVCISHNAAWKS